MRYLIYVNRIIANEDNGAIEVPSRCSWEIRWWSWEKSTASAATHTPQTFLHRLHDRKRFLQPVELCWHGLGGKKRHQQLFNYKPLGRARSRRRRKQPTDVKAHSGSAASVAVPEQPLDGPAVTRRRTTVRQDFVPSSAEHQSGIGRRLKRRVPCHALSNSWYGPCSRCYNQASQPRVESRSFRNDTNSQRAT